MRALVLAGGLGTRLREKLPDLPKAMAPIAGRPFLEYLLDRLVRGGVREVILSVGYRAEAIRAHFGARYRGTALRYAVEPAPLGTGGAIAFALRGEPEAPVIVVNGDTLLDCDFPALLAWYLENPAPLAVVLRRVSDTSRYGAVTLAQDRIIRYAEKGASGPGLINAGIYLLLPTVLSRFGLAERFSFETDLLQRHCAEIRPRAWISDAYFIDIGVAEDLERAQRELPLLKIAPDAASA